MTASLSGKRRASPWAFAKVSSVVAAMQNIITEHGDEDFVYSWDAYRPLKLWVAYWFFALQVEPYVGEARELLTAAIGNPGISPSMKEEIQEMLEGGERESKSNPK